jgi:hypothetical protein
MSTEGSEIQEAPPHDRTHFVGPEPHVLMDGPVHEGRGQEAPDSVHKKHECPPDRVAMMQNLEEITASYNARLVNQRQVIENLSRVRQNLLAANAEFESFVRYVAHDFTGDYALSERAMRLLNASETP